MDHRNQLPETDRKLVQSSQIESYPYNTLYPYANPIYIPVHWRAVYDVLHTAGISTVQYTQS